MPASVLPAYVGFVIDALGQGAGEFDWSYNWQANPAFAVVLDLGDAAGGPEGTLACELAFDEGGRAGLEVRVAPVGDGAPEVHERALGDSGSHFGYEGVILVLAGIEGLVYVLPGRPWHPVGAVETMGGYGARL